MTTHTTAVERIARVLAGRELSANAEGAEGSAGASVSALWQEHADGALSILKALREPDPVMAAAGDPAIWQNMVEAAIAAEEGARSFQAEEI